MNIHLVKYLRFRFRIFKLDVLYKHIVIFTELHPFQIMEGFMGLDMPSN